MLLNKGAVWEKLKQTARDYLTALQTADYEHIWNDLITLEAMNLLSSALFPMYAYKEEQVDKLLELKFDETISITEGVALAFQMDVEGIRSNFFHGMAEGTKGIGWYEFSDEESYVFVEDDKAILLAETPGIPLVMPFVKDSANEYRVDLEALTVFSMYVSASAFYQIGVRALEIDRRSSSVSYFELAASLAKPYQRLRHFLIDNIVVQQLITEQRKQEIQEEEKYVLFSRDQVLRLLSGPQLDIVMDIGKFLSDTFRGYAEISQTDVSSQELDRLYELDDAALREALASILVGVDPIAAQREAEKPHGPAEIADMELPIQISSELYYLCLPVKSGREIKTDSVPVSISYQIIRPFMYFPRCVVIFVTAKPCSQYLFNYIKAARATQGWSIGVIQYKELAKLLKINEFLK